MCKNSAILFIALFAASTSSSALPQLDEASIVFSGGVEQNNNNKGGGGFFPGVVEQQPEVNQGQRAVAFTAVRATRQSREAPSAIQFERTLTQAGRGWRQDEGAFVARSPGLYVFTFSAVGEKTSRFRLSLRQNDRDVAHAWGEERGYNSASNTVVLNLAKRDRVTLHLVEGALYEPTTGTPRGYTTFTGYKLN